MNFIHLQEDTAKHFVADLRCVSTDTTEQNGMAFEKFFFKIPKTSLHCVGNDKDGNLSVLSRFTPALREGEKQQNGSLYLMHVDCDQKLFRDTSVNGLHRFRAEWKPSDGDELIDAVIDEVCTAEVT